jgi:hypothetical protein
MYLKSTNKTSPHIMYDKLKKNRKNTKVKKKCYSDSKFITRKVTLSSCEQCYLPFPIFFLTCEVMQKFQFEICNKHIRLSVAQTI